MTDIDKQVGELMRLADAYALGLSRLELNDTRVKLETAIRAALQSDQAPADAESTSASTAAIEFALKTHCDGGVEFLRAWFQGDFDVIRKEWPEAPEAVFIGADPLHKYPQAVQPLLAQAPAGEAVADGFALVPIEPTREMIEAGAHSINMNYHYSKNESLAKHAFRAMLAAKPAQPAQAPAGDGCGCCGDGCKDRGSCRHGDENPPTQPDQSALEAVALAKSVSDTSALSAAIAEAVEPYKRDAERLDFLDRPGFEIGIDLEPEDGYHVVVYRVSGSRNDREWKELGRGTNIRSAIGAALAKSKDGER